MLVGGDLGFSFGVVVAAFVVLFGPVVGFVVRRKWRRAAARREEIKRLIVLASEEAALAEYDSRSSYGYGYDYGYGYAQDEGYGNGSGNGYGYGYDSVVAVEDQVVPTVAAVEAQSPGGISQKLHPCAVCSALTRTRCKQCKAIHYCSGKCQIIHWRQGHKDECRPYKIIDQKNDAGFTSDPNASKQERDGSYNDYVDVQGHSSPESVEVPTGQPAFLNSSLPKLDDGKNGTEVEHRMDDKGRNPNLEFANGSLSESDSSSELHNYDSHDSDKPNQPLSNYRHTEKMQTDFAKTVQPKTSVSEKPISISSVDSVDLSSKHSQMKPINDYSRSSSVSPSSYGSGVTGSSKPILSEPSTSSSGFWEGKLVRNRSRIGAPDGVSHSSSNGADESSVPPAELSGTTISRMVTSNAKSVTVDGSQPRKPTDQISHSVEDNSANLISRRSPMLSARALNDNVVNVSNVKVSRPRELLPQSSGATGKLMSEAISKDRDLRSLTSKKSNQEAVSRLTSSDKTELRNVESVLSKPSGTPLPSHSDMPVVRSVKAAKNGSVHGVAGSSQELKVHQQNAKTVLKTSVLKVVDQHKPSTLTKENTFGSSSEIVAKYKVLFPYEVFVKLYHWNKIELRPRGLVNCGNSCYANAVLQCLAFTPPLTAYFLQGLHTKSCQKRDWCFICEFQSLVLKAKEVTTAISPIRIISHLQNIGSHLSNGREEDAHEFLRCAIDVMQSICLREAGIKESGSLGEETTLIGLTFGGYLRSKIECMRCGGKSERHERMMDLTVEIDGDIGTLEEALRKFTHAETLDGDNKYQCSRCKSYEKARKKLKVLDAPNVLTIVLKRFESGRFGKLNKTIKFPEILDMAPYICGTSDKLPIYRLYGVVVHLDLMNAAFSGHYVCYVKNIQNMWFKVDDSMVKPVELANVLTKGAYMLLYARCSPRSPRLIRKSVPRDLRKGKHHTCKPSSTGLSAGPRDASASHPPDGQQTCHAEEDSSSDHSSFFSEGGTCSTDSSNRDSTSNEDYFEPILGDMGASWRHSSDSDTSSASSSPSPLFTRQSQSSPLSDTDRYAEQRGLWARPATSSHPEASDSNKVNVDAYSSHHPGDDSSKQSRKFGSVSSNSSSRETDANRIGRMNPFDRVTSGVAFRRSASERTGNL